MATTTINKSQKGVSLQSPKGSMRVQEFFFLCLSKWPWFVLSILVCMAIGYVHFKKTPPTYGCLGSIMIKTDSRGHSIANNQQMFEDLGITSASNSVEDEVALFKSPDLMQDVVSRLNLNTLYSTKGNFRDLVLYGSSLPVSVEMPGMTDKNRGSFKLTLLGNGEYEISDMSLNGKALNRAPMRGRIGSTIKSPYGNLTVIPGPSYSPQAKTEINVNHLTVPDAAGMFQGGFVARISTQSKNIVELGQTDQNFERARDIVKEMINVYNDRWIAEKRVAADNSSKFIDERVAHLQQELGEVENDISQFKSSNLMPDVQAAASMYVGESTAATSALRDLRNQEYMAKYVRDYLKNSENHHRMLPSSAGLQSSTISSGINQYNTKLMERNSLVSQSSANNPLVVQMDQELAALRGALLATLDNEMLALQTQIRTQENVSGMATSKIASNPRQAKYLLSVERQQKVKEQLYLYLLQKREENQLGQAFTSFNTRIIQEPNGVIYMGQDKNSIMTMSFVIGLLIPMLILFVKECSVHVVRGRKDIKNMRIPFAGELPLHAKRQKLQRPSLKPKESVPVVAVKENNRNAINEAFRVVRTNVEFMLGGNNQEGAKVVMLTSLNPGSGKTFISYNLSLSFAIKGKRVLVIDMDMRKASLSKYIKGHHRGIADYLANRVDDIESTIITNEETPNLSVIPVGTIPPNPTELLFNDRLRTLLADIRKKYDFVFIDCPPVEVVADASIIGKLVDNTLFVVRAGMIDLAMLPTIDEYYETNAYPNMSLILNGTVNPKSGYYGRYTNSYAYGYGYGYGYSKDD